SIYYGGKIPFIRSAEINKTETELFLTKQGLKNSSAQMVKKGDILVALYGANSGDVAISRMGGAINQAILCLETKNNHFVYQFLVCKKDQIVSTYIQGGQGNLSGKIIKSVTILIPQNEKEQQKIAECLSAADEMITAQEQKIEALKEHKKGLLQQLFPNLEEVAE
ncbi:MAG: restriction endonuclease subunit S, partial [Salinispira sp.]